MPSSNKNLAITNFLFQKPSNHSDLVLASRSRGGPQWNRPRPRGLEDDPMEEGRSSSGHRRHRRIRHHGMRRRRDRRRRRQRTAAARSRSARSLAPTSFDPARLGVGQPRPVLPGGVRHAPARDPRGDDRALARDRVVVQRRQHGPHPHAPRRRHVQRRLRPRPADVVATNLQRFKDGTSPDTGYFANVTTIEAPDATTVVITLSAPDPALLNYLTRDPGLVGSSESLESADLRHDPGRLRPVRARHVGHRHRHELRRTRRTPDYWNPDVQHYDKLVINVLERPDRRAQRHQGRRGERRQARQQRQPRRGRGRRLDRQRQRARLPGSAAARPRRHHGARARRRQGAPGDQLRVRPRRPCSTALGADKGTVDDAGVPRLERRVRRRARRVLHVRPREGEGAPRRGRLPGRLHADHADGCRASARRPTRSSSSSWPTSASRSSTPRSRSSNFIADLLAPKYPASFMALEQNPDWQLIQFMIAPTAVVQPVPLRGPARSTST